MNAPDFPAWLLTCPSDKWHFSPQNVIHHCRSSFRILFSWWHVIMHTSHTCPRYVGTEWGTFHIMFSVLEGACKRLLVFLLWVHELARGSRDVSRPPNLFFLSPSPEMDSPESPNPNIPGVPSWQKLQTFTEKQADRDQGHAASTVRNNTGQYKQRKMWLKPGNFSHLTDLLCHPSPHTCHWFPGSRRNLRVETEGAFCSLSGPKFDIFR